MSEETDPTGQGSVRFTNWLWLPAVIGVGLLLLFTIPTWMVNFDGTAYLALGANLRDFTGFVGPDGSAMTIRGPGYPSVLSLGWLFGGYSSGLAMIVSRIVLVAGGTVAATVAWRLTSSPFVAFVAGLLVLSQPVLLPAGATAFTPDGTGATLGLIAVLLLLLTVRDDATIWPFLTSGFVISLALITKESHALVMIGGVLWILTRNTPLGMRLRQIGLMGAGFTPVFVAWMAFGIGATGELPGALPHVDAPLAWVFVALIPAVSGLLVFGSRWAPDAWPPLPVWFVAVLTFGIVLALTAGFREFLGNFWHVPAGILDLVSSQGYRGVTIVAALGLLGLAFLGWRQIENRDSASLMLIVICATLGLYVYMALAGAAIRNGALLPMLLGALGGVALSGGWVGSWKSISAIAGVVIVAGAGVVGMVRLTDSIDANRLTAEAGPTVAAAEWLTTNANEAPTAGTPAYFQSVWRLGDRSRDVALLPMYTMPISSWNSGNRAFDVRYDWLGRTRNEERRQEAASYSFNDWGVGAVFAEDLEETSVSSRYLVVSGNTRYPSSAADGGVVVLLLKDAEGVRPVFVDRHREAQWVAIFEFVGDLNVDVDRPLVRYAKANPKGVDTSQGLGLVEYADAVGAALDELARQVPATLPGS